MPELGDRYMPSRNPTTTRSFESHAGQAHASRELSRITANKTCEWDKGMSYVGSDGDEESLIEYQSFVESKLGLKEDRVLRFSRPEFCSKLNTDELFGYKDMKDGVHKSVKTVSSRKIAKAPVKTLDAPDIVDDFYLNVLDWGSQNALAVGLSEALYVWDAEHGSTSLAFESPDELDIITAVKWCPFRDNVVALSTHGGSRGKTVLYDLVAEKALRKFRGHTDRVCSLDWNTQNKWLTTGSRDNQILNFDVRQKGYACAMGGHSGEVSGLSWNSSGRMLASGGNDNLACVFDVRKGEKSSMDAPLLPQVKLLGHQGAIRALSWSERFSHVLATGGGATDRTLKFWNSQTFGSAKETMDCISSTNVGSQISSIVFNPHADEFITTHGSAGSGRNELKMWRYPELTRFKELHAHQDRILSSTLSPCGTTICTASADETLRFWRVFEEKSSNEKHVAAQKVTPEYAKLKLR